MAKRNASGSRKRLLVPVDSTDDDEEEDLQSLRRSRLRTLSSASLPDEDFKSMRSAKARMARRNLSGASLPEEDFKSMRSAKARMARRNLSSASLRVQETEDDYTDEEDDYVPLTPRKSSKAKRGKPWTSFGNLDDVMARLQGFMPMGMGSPHTSASGSNSRPGSPIYIGGNPYTPMYGGSISPLIGPSGYGYGLPGLTVNSEISSIVYSNVGNDNSVKKVYRK